MFGWSFQRIKITEKYKFNEILGCEFLLFVFFFFAQKYKFIAVWGEKAYVLFLHFIKISEQIGSYKPISKSIALWMAKA